jgi:hypothetical protein
LCKEVEMGYTHYYHLLDTDTKLAEMFLGASKIVKIANASGKVCKLKLNDNMTSFTITGTNRDNTCEQFDWPPENGFCKTVRLPYDTVVCVCLMVAKDIFQTNVDISSDGEWDSDWSDAVQLYTTIFKAEPTCPFDDIELCKECGYDYLSCSCDTIELCEKCGDDDLLCSCFCT